MRRILITGGTGQVGLELRRLAWPEDVEVVWPDRSALDIRSAVSVDAFLNRGPWSAVINCAAWTAVDLAEDQLGEAFLANAQGPAYLAERAHRLNVPIIHVSTDYVFDGQLDRPYRESDPVAPLGAYGASKLAGELAITFANPRSVILRTAWVVSAHRSNFLKSMLRLAATNPQMRVVADQFGCPTSAVDIARTLATITLRLVDDDQCPTGVYHFVNAGRASWHELACHIFECSARLGAPQIAVVPITSAEYPTKARRPANSCLDSALVEADFGIVPRPWRESVSEIVIELHRLVCNQGN